MRTTAIILLLLAFGLAGLLGVAEWRGLPENETKTARGSEVLLRERGVAIDKTTIADRLGPADHSVAAAGHFVCIDLRITNHAKVVDSFTFPDHAAVLLDDDNRAFHVDADATSIVRQADPNDHGGELAAGASRVTHLAFDVPVDAKGLRLRLEFGGPLGNVINRALDGSTTFALE